MAKMVKKKVKVEHEKHPHPPNVNGRMEFATKIKDKCVHAINNLTDPSSPEVLQDIINDCNEAIKIFHKKEEA